MTSWEMWLAQAEVTQEDFVECTHDNTELRRRRLSNGSVSLVSQCLTCGSSVGQPVAHHRVTARLFDWDDDLKDRWSAARSGTREQRRAAARLAYQEYLKSDEWAERRTLVLLRAAGKCEGCGQAGATQVHHLTYAHVFEEFLFELIAVCRGCHERLHDHGEDGHN